MTANALVREGINFDCDGDEKREEIIIVFIRETLLCIRDSVKRRFTLISTDAPIIKLALREKERAH